MRSTFRRLEGSLAASDDLVKAALVLVIVVSVILLIQPSRTARLAAAAWLILP